MFYARNPQVRERLAGTLVSIVGCGSFGSAMADMLARAGIGRLALIDPETLAVENLGRHVLTAADVGQPKAFALARRLREINPELQIDARQERFRAAEGVLVCCADSRRCESQVNAISLANGLPAMYVGAYGAVRAGEVQVVVPSRTACRECFAQFRGYEEAVSGPERYTDPDFDATRVPGQEGLWGSVLAVSGVAFHMLLALLGVRGQLDYERPLWIVNLDYEGFQPFAVTFAKVARGCAVCDESRVADLSIASAE